MTEYQIVVDRRAVRDVDAAANWYEDERPGLGQEFLAELHATYQRILSGPFSYQVQPSDVRRAPLRRFPYAVFFAVEETSSSWQLCYMSGAIQESGNVGEIHDRHLGAQP